MAFIEAGLLISTILLLFGGWRAFDRRGSDPAFFGAASSSRPGLSTTLRIVL